MMRARSSLAAYRWVGDWGGPLIAAWLWQRARVGKENPARLSERKGIASQPRPEGFLVWFHAASVGEAVSILPVITAVRQTRPEWRVLITTGTVTSAALLADRLPDGVVHQFVPVDRSAWVRRFLDHWQPQAAVFVESEVWPGLLTASVARAIPLILLNGRLSTRSARRWQRLPDLAKRLFGDFSLILAQTPEDAERFRAVGAERVEYLGNLKSAAPPLPVDAEALEGLRREVGNRPLWLAASTHPGEEALIARVQRRVLEQIPTLLCVIAPRHAVRGAEVARDCAGLVLARRSLGEPVTASTQVYIADTMGELGVFYRLCRVVVMGKSLIGHGGQNPLEAARLGCAVLFGPHMENFATIAGHLLEAGAAQMVADEEALTEQLASLLSHPAEVSRRGEAGERVATAEAEVIPTITQRLLSALTEGATHAA